MAAEEGGGWRRAVGGRADVGPAGEDEGAGAGHARTASPEVGTRNRNGRSCAGTRPNVPRSGFRVPRSTQETRPGAPNGLRDGKLAAAYSPTTSQSQYHRR